MSGQVTINQAGTQSQITLHSQSNDGSGWQLQASLTAQQSRARRGAASTDASFPVAGSFTLTNPGATAISGSASGDMARTGSGQLHLTSDDGTVVLDSSFAIDSGNGLTLSITGNLPSLAAAATGADANAHIFWYVSRAAGLTAYLLLALSVCLGILVRTRIMDWLVARWRWFDLHQFTALLALAFVLLHIGSLLGDHFIGFTIDQLLIPFASPYRTLPTAAGVMAFYVMLVVVGSFWLRRLIGYRLWRAIHYATFGLFLLALAHGIFSGTDTGQIWTTAMYWGSGTLVGALTIWRFTTATDSPSQTRPDGPARLPRTREFESTFR
jgi:cytochrome b561